MMMLASGLALAEMIKMGKPRIKKELEIQQKTLNFSNYKLKDLFGSVKKWQNWTERPKEYQHMSRDINGRWYKYYNDIPNELKQIYCTVQLKDGEHRSYEVGLNKKNLDVLQEVFYYLDNRDSLHVEVIEWDNDECLVLYSHNLIISSTWLTIAKKKDVLKFFEIGGK